MSSELEAENKRLKDRNVLLEEQCKSLQEVLADALADLDKQRRNELGMNDLDFGEHDYSHLDEVDW